MEQINILITSAGRRVSLVKAFKNEIFKLGLSSKVYTTDMVPSLSAACQVADGFFEVNRVNAPTYITRLLEICIKNNIKIVIPTIDTELQTLAVHRETFADVGITIVLSSQAIIDKCRDKRLIHSFFDEINFRRAQDVVLTETIPYPIFVKPYDGSRSVGIHIIASENDFTDEIRNNPKNLFLEYFDAKTHDEYTVDIYYNKDSKIISITPRQRIFVRDGEVNKACTRKNRIISYVIETMDNIKGFVGCITLQVFLNNETNIITGIEINPRFGGGYPLTYLAGGNYPLWILKEYLLSEPVDTYLDDWQENLLMLRYDDEVLLSNYHGS